MDVVLLKLIQLKLIAKIAKHNMNKEQYDKIRPHRQAFQFWADFHTWPGGDLNEINAISSELGQRFDLVCGGCVKNMLEFVFEFIKQYENGEN